MADNILGIVGQLDISNIFDTLQKLHSVTDQISSVSQEMAKKLEDAYKAVGNASQEELAQKTKDALETYSQTFEQAKDATDKSVSSIEKALNNLQDKLAKALDEKGKVSEESERYRELEKEIAGLNEQIANEEQHLARTKEEANALAAAMEKIASAKMVSDNTPQTDGLEQSKESAEILLAKLDELQQKSKETAEKLQEINNVGDTKDLLQLKKALEDYNELTRQTADTAKAAYNQQREYINEIQQSLSKLEQARKNAESDPEALDALNKKYSELEQELSKAEQKLPYLEEAFENATQNSHDLVVALDAVNQKINGTGESSEKTAKQTESLWQKLKGWATGHGKLSEGLDTFKKGLDKLPIPLRTATEGVGDMVKGMWAMCKTPLGMVLAAISLALQTLFQWFTKNAEGQKQFARVSAYLSSILSSLSDIAIKLGEYLFHAFADAGGPMHDFAKGLVTTFKSAVSAVIDL